MDLITVVAGVVAAVITFFLIFYFIRRIFSKVVNREQVYLMEIIALLFSLSLFFAIVSPQAQLHHLFYLIFAIFIVSTGIILLGTWRILQEYLTGLFITRVLDLHVGDYLEFDHMRGYITALEDAFIVLRDPRREYVYIPYTSLLQFPFRRVKTPEGHEVRIRLYIPRGHDLKKVRDIVATVAREYGLEKLNVDVERIGLRGVLLVVRGVLKDPRQEDEVKYAILDRVYAEIADKAFSTR
ncbi:mechanosensitive ion channel domain-containing protein [Pyrobaculum aerophilum]|uniref:mechanosensitive ion channel domain-containing protein n=1 Tax=Pyrobaculum aerophilum TaxID=13773 RepID=UPI0023F41059|nr:MULTISPECIES: mechanosensitive ion channel domain-containing protein [Pyrobaculum]MCX8135764.1 mechanosensitive ion channel [Pyrobaculum aerophilum]